MAIPNARPLAKANTVRAKLIQAFDKKLLISFENYGSEVIEAVRRTHPITYLRLVAALRPGNLYNHTLSELTDDRLDELLAYLGRFTGPEENADAGTDPPPRSEPPTVLPTLSQAS